MVHALQYAFAQFDLDEAFVMYIGGDRSGNLLEIGTVEADDGRILIVHAMNARSRFLR